MAAPADGRVRLGSGASPTKYNGEISNCLCRLATPTEQAESDERGAGERERRGFVDEKAPDFSTRKQGRVNVQVGLFILDTRHERCLSRCHRVARIEGACD